MPELRKDSFDQAEDQENLLVAYKAACDRHQQIDEFRGKLLALLPIASGGIGLLLIGERGTFESYLTPIGIYGLVATSGLFIYELYGISVCKQIMGQAAGLEKRLNIPESMGQFRDRKESKPRERLIQAEIASWVVYLSVLSGWLYIACAHAAWDRPWPWWILGVVAILLARAAAIAFPRWWEKNLTCRRGRRKAKEAAEAEAPEATEAKL
jgi:hypothetical protein